MPGVNPGVVTALDCPAAFLRAEQEMEFVEKNRLSCLTLKDEAYPSRLRECEDAPIVLFFKGNTDFNRLHVIDMVVHAVPPITASNSVPTSCAIWPFFVPMCW